ncbi:MAG: c-type cytochrome [Saprospiraceae bacterium]|nr:c-type cytochrome [Bacteroidia bacterium]NNE14595.1 c-type cytochrome [Saprospiraceae bacterium]NNL91132.1 c-type cytochrome [Saprospiraceae bacterium]
MIALAFLISCEKEVKPIPKSFGLFEMPNGFDVVEHPTDNQYTKARWDLGKKLFFDPIMSLDSTISCSSCHKPELAFSDDVAFSKGVDGAIGMRNAPSLANVSYHPYFTREGGVPTLEMQILVPIQEHNEFNFNIVLLAERLSQNSEYVELTHDAYNRSPDPFTITRSLSCFERSLISGYSKYDQYINYGNLDVLNDSEIRGMNLFFSDKTNCVSCHGGFNFTNYEFANNGLYESYPDKGRFRLTGLNSDLAMFKIPSLRNVELTSPYMHDGSFKTLKEVILHYNEGGKSNTQKSNLIQPLNLSSEEIDDLVSFLKSLTDQTFINNPIFKN